MIDTIIFDCGDVFLRGLLGVEKKIAKKFGVKAAFVVNGVLGGEKKRLLFEGKISETEFWKRTLKQHHANVSIAFLKKTIRKNFVPVPEVKKIVLSLKPRYKIALLSDNCIEWAKFCEKKYSLKKIFHARQYSFQNGLRKIHPAAHRQILKKLKSTPENTLFIDDIPKNLRVAKKLGIKTIEFHNAKTLKKQLGRFGIKIKAK